MHGISVVIPTYNREAQLDRALQSVFKQIYPCDEIIVVDDGSTDNTKELVASYIETKHAVVKYLYQPNKGPAAARNLGVRNSSYSHIAFLDSDDHWHKDKLKKQFAKMEEKPDILISHTKEKWLRRGKHLNQKKKHQPGNGDIFEHCLQLCAVGMSTVMVRREIFETVGYFDESYRCCEDYDLWIRTSCNHPFLLINAPLTIKEGGREDQVSYQYRVGMDKFRIDSIMSLLVNGVLTNEQRQSCFEELHKKSRVYGNGCIKHNKIAEGNRYLEVARYAEQQGSSEKNEAQLE